MITGRVELVQGRATVILDADGERRLLRMIGCKVGVIDVSQDVGPRLDDLEINLTRALSLTREVMGLRGTS